MHLLFTDLGSTGFTFYPSRFWAVHQNHKGRSSLFQVATDTGKGFSQDLLWLTPNADRPITWIKSKVWICSFVSLSFSLSVPTWSFICFMLVNDNLWVELHVFSYSSIDPDVTAVSPLLCSYLFPLTLDECVSIFSN